MPLDFNAPIIEEFRTNAGRLGGPFEGWVLLLLTTTGARSGKEHTTPLGFVEDGDRLLVVGSAGGSDRHPDWYRNVLANPTVTVEVATEAGIDTWQATAVAATGTERDALFAKVVAAAPGYADYQRVTDRVLPVVVLHRIPVSDYTPPNRLDALADELVKVHDWLRGELAALADGLAAPGAAELTVELRRHCLTFCTGLAHHHGGEDAGLFPYLAREFPEKADAFERLRAEHAGVSRALDGLRELLARVDETEPGDLRPEFDRLRAELEAHFAYEEAEVLPLLRAAAPVS
ncbi:MULTISPECIES: nitroreductase/quinone reductase family protein [unclassified Streptomyces]|uniref:nitroreductase/quinone reductase family protein n=1 Tax=unclassified Streptomyces TaxID=2593676 RepID=UPI00332F8D56